jgi:CRISPR/Cas system endoribonuclease Cas6 (RAMP superfamily)
VDIMGGGSNLYNLTVGLKLKKGNYIDEDCIKYVSNICCYLIGNEKDNYINCKNCGQHKVNKVKTTCGKESLFSCDSNKECIMKESFMVRKDEIRLFINSSFYGVINKLVQELFKLQDIHIGQYEFDVYDIELVSLERLKEERKKTICKDEYVKTYSSSLKDEESENLAHSM